MLNVCDKSAIPSGVITILGDDPSPSTIDASSLSWQFSLEDPDQPTSYCEDAATFEGSATAEFGGDWGLYDPHLGAEMVTSSGLQAESVLQYSVRQKCSLPPTPFQSKCRLVLLSPPAPSEQGDSGVIVYPGLEIGPGDYPFCDNSANYVFRDSHLLSATQDGNCEVDLRFKKPYTGIYRISLSTTNRGGLEKNLQSDEYGRPAHGIFTLVIDSCANPYQFNSPYVPGLVEIVDPSVPTCEVVDSKWDADVKSVRTTVIRDVEHQKDLQISGISPYKIDSSDYPSLKDLSLVYLPTGPLVVPDETLPTSYLSSYDTVALAQKWSFSDVPSTWAGDDTQLTETELNERPKSHPLSAHGAWYTGNGLVRIPPGTSLTTFVPIGTSMSGWLG
jgi:hypothetical protein